jgi:DNA-binding LacI/PurR family transcriptional regulator
VIAKKTSGRRTTLSDVAEASGVSLMTVSNVVNGRTSAVGEDTRQRVEKQIRRLNYRPHASARSLRLARRWSVGMIIVHESPSFLADPFLNQVVAGLNNFLCQRGYGLFLHGLKRADLESSMLVRHIGTDGLCAIISGSKAQRLEVMQRLMTLGQPLVLFQDPAEFPGADVCSIRADDFHGGQLLAEHVLAKGAKRLLMLEPNLQWASIDERKRGIRKVLRRVPDAELASLAFPSDALAAAQQHLAGYIDGHGLPDAMLGTDQLAVAALKFLARRKVRVPQDVLVTGFNAFEFSQYTDPVLTTVRSTPYELGNIAGEAILDRFETGTFSRRSVVLPVSLQEGGST